MEECSKGPHVRPARASHTRGVTFAGGGAAMGGVRARCGVHARGMSQRDAVRGVVRSSPSGLLCMSHCVICVTYKVEEDRTAPTSRTRRWSLPECAYAAHRRPCAHAAAH